MILVYDRFEKGEPVPNGYPRNFHYLKEVNDYTQYFKKEPTVHQMFDYDIEIKASDDVESDFIYPIHQYGALEKVTGYEDNYTEFNFFHHMKPKTLEKIRKRKGVISILAFEESRIPFNVFVHIHEMCNKFKVPTELINIITGHNYTEFKKYKRWCKLMKQKPMMLVNSFSQMYMKGGDLVEKESKNTFVTKEDIDKNKKIKRKHKFLCFNRRIRPPRYAVMAMLHDNNLIENNLISFSIEKIPNLNCLGDGGYPDVDTMARILGKNNPLLETYLNYYDDLMEMSPLVVDYENLLDVMGPGCETKEPYLNSYFSIVTETVFNERIGMTSEKIWRPMLHFHPFIVHGSKGTLKEIKKLGFKTFHPHIDESYDEESDVAMRMKKFSNEIIRICNMSDDEIHQWYNNMLPILNHNHKLISEYGKKYSTDGKFHGQIILDVYNEMKGELDV